MNKQNFNWNSIIKHGKSFAVLQMLEYEIGEDLLFEVLMHCLATFKGVNVTLDLFQNTCERITGTNLSWFFDQWYLTISFIEYRITSVESIKDGNKYLTSCEIQKIGDAVATHLDIGFHLSNGDMEYKEIDGLSLRNGISFESLQPVTEIIIDPELKYPLINRSSWTVLE